MKSIFKKKASLLGLVGLCLALIAGCSSQQPVRAPVLPDPYAFKGSGTEANQAEASEETAAFHDPALYWWRSWGSEELESLVDQALLTNPRLQIAAQKVIQAQAKKNESRSSLWPEIQARANYDISAPRGGLGSVPEGEQPTSIDAYQAMLEGSWTLDFFDERSAFAEAAGYQYTRALYEYEQTLSQTIASIVKNYIDYLALNDRIVNAQANEQALSQMQETIESLYNFGETTSVELHLQRSSRRNSQVILPTLENERLQVINQLALLTGQPISQVHLSSQGLKHLNLDESIQQLNSRLVLNRPDVIALEMGMHAAKADLHVARAKLLPQFNISANLGSGSRSLSEILQPHTLLWGFLAEVSTSIFDAGRVRENVNYAESVYAELIESYTYAIYSGLIEIQNNLTSIEAFKNRIYLQNLATESAFSANNFSLEAYLAGGIDFLTYLDAVKNYRERKDDLIIYQQEYMNKWVDLYSSLGGGVPHFTEAEQKQLSFFQNNNEGNKEAYEADPDDYFIEFSGVYNYLSIEALLTHLQKNYDTYNFDAGLSILALPIIEEEKDEADYINLQASNWYKINLSGFSEEERAAEMCRQFLNTYWRCTVHPEQEAYSDAMVFTIEKEKASDFEDPVMLLAQPSDEKPQVNEHEEVEENQSAHWAFERAPAPSLSEPSLPEPSLDAAKISSGSTSGSNESKGHFEPHSYYSLIAVMGDQALIMGNNTYRTWVVQEGEPLDYEGQVQSIKSDSVTLSFAEEEVTLQPVQGYFISDSMNPKQRAKATKDYLIWKKTVASLYSLITIENNQAWLIGNNSYRVWKVGVSDPLHYDGFIEKVGENEVVLNFNDFLLPLSPVYDVEIIEPNKKARLTWLGIHSSNSFQHDIVKDSWIYGGGIVEEIGASGIRVIWDRTKSIYLPAESQ